MMQRRHKARAWTHPLEAFTLLLSAYQLITMTWSASLVEPVEISSHNTVWSMSLEVQGTRVSTDAVIFNSRVFCYQGKCGIPGPTIRAKPGDRVSITLVNNLGPETSASNDMTTTMNAFHGPNITNIHTHGLHVDPNIDTIFIQVQPGASYTYVYDIPANHAPGLHWYHAHKHGSVTLGIMSGLVGAFIIEPTAASNLPASITSLKEHVLVITHTKFDQSTIGGVVSQGCGNGAPCQWFQGCSSTASAPFHPFRWYSLPEITTASHSPMDPNPSFTEAGYKNIYQTNGQTNPSIAMAPGEKRRLRIVHAVGAGFLELSLPRGCSASIVAKDGVYLTQPQAIATNYLMPPSHRADLIVSCASAGSYAFEGRYGEGGSTDNGMYVRSMFTLAVSGTTVSSPTVTAAEMAAIVRPFYLQSLQSATPGTFHSVEFSQGGRNPIDCRFWMGGGTDCTPIWKGRNPSTTDPTCPFAEFSGQKGGNGLVTPASAAYKYKLVGRIGSVNEWKVYGAGRDAHTLHLHVHHMQIISFTPTVSGSIDSSVHFTPGEWRDTIPALDGELTVRFMPSEFPGETVLHCHFLRHEDLGMMDTVYFCDPNVAGSCPPSYFDTPGGAASPPPSPVSANRPPPPAPAAGSSPPPSPIGTRRPPPSSVNSRRPPPAIRKRKPPPKAGSARRSPPPARSPPAKQPGSVAMKPPKPPAAPAARRQ